MEQEINEAVSALLEYGLMDVAEAARDRNYVIWLVQFFIQPRFEAKRLFGF